MCVDVKAYQNVVPLERSSSFTLCARQYDGFWMETIEIYKKKEKRTHLDKYARQMRDRGSTLPNNPNPGDLKNALFNSFSRMRRPAATAAAARLITHPAADDGAVTCHNVIHMYARRVIQRGRMAAVKRPAATDFYSCSLASRAETYK